MRTFLVLASALCLVATSSDARADDASAPARALGSDVPDTPVVPVTPVAAPAASATFVDVVYSEPGCVGASGTSIGMLKPLAEHFRAAPQALRAERVAFAPQRRGDVILFPDDLGDSETVDAFFAASGDIVREVVDDELVALENDREVMFQWPRRERADWISVVRAGAGSVRVRRGRLVALRRGSVGLRALELDDAVAFGGVAEGGVAFGGDAAGAGDAKDPASWYFQPSFSIVVRHAGEEVRLYEFGKRHGEEGRTVAELKAMIASSTGVVVHPGSLLGGFGVDDDRQPCAAITRDIGFDAVGLRGAELALGFEALTGFAAEARLPLVAANLESAAGQRLPGFVMKEVAGKAIAIVGLVGADDLERLPASVRAQWKVEPALEVAPRVLRQLREERPTPPDLIVVLTNARDAELRQLRSVSGVDVIIGDFANGDLVPRTKRVTFAAPVAAGEERQVSVVVERAGHSVGRARAQFAPIRGANDPPHSSNADASTPMGLVGFEVEERPVLQEGPVDAPTRALMRPLMERARRRQGVLLPDVTALLDLHDDVRRAVVGPRIVTYRRVQEVTAQDAHYTDALWHRLMNHVLQDVVDADVALTASVPRGDNIRGPVPALSVESWLPSNQSVVVLDIDGAALTAALAVLAAVDASDGAPLEKRVYASGVDVSRRLVAGRPIEPRRRYRIVATDAALDGAVLSPVVSGVPRRTRFRADGARQIVDDDGTALTLRAVVLARLATYADGGYDDAARRRLVDELLRERGAIVRPELRARVEEVGLQGSAYQNSSNNLALFSETRETRSTTPDLYTIGLRLRGDVTYDHPAFAVELGGRAIWNTVLINVPGVVVPPQEQADDVQGWAELRLNNLRVSLGDGGFGVVPFVRAAVDTEVTATPLPSYPTKTLPHQLLLPQSLGLVASPGGAVREVRLGAVVQQDLSPLTAGDGRVNLDAGIVAGLRLEVPLWALLLQSDNDVRYLVPDGDDRSTDLALRFMSTTKLVLPVNQTTNVFIFADAFVVAGKTSVNSALGGSVIVGGGLAFADLFAWR